LDAARKGTPSQKHGNATVEAATEPDSKCKFREMKQKIQISVPSNKELFETTRKGFQQRKTSR